MENQKKLTNENTVIFFEQNSNQFGEKIAARNQANAQGKRFEVVNDPITKTIIEGALDISLFETHFNIFLSAFKDHKLQTLVFWKKTEGFQTIYKYDELVGEVVSIVEVLEEKSIQKYFIESIISEIRRSNTIGTDIEFAVAKTVKMIEERTKNYFREKPNIVSDAKQVKRIKKTISYEELFKYDKERLAQFWELLRGANLCAIDEKNNWTYNSRKSSIVACFKALEDLGFIKLNLSKAELRRVVGTKINFQGNEKLFRNDYDDGDYYTFYEVFENNLKS